MAAVPGVKDPAPAPPAVDELRQARLTELGMAFRQVFRTLSRLRGRDTHLAGTELSHAQFELLLELSERGALSAGELATAARLSPGTVTQMLDGLAESGHVERARSETDRRVVVTHLTPVGGAQIAAKREAWQSRWEQALAGFAPRELATATRVLEKLGEMFDQAPVTAACEEPPEASRDGGKPA
jgi:DNA-binding MarR family transcriptional regulator